MLKTYSRQPAFTLAELLVTLGLLAVIAAFTIPKLMNGTNTQEREANFRKGIAIIQEMVDDGVSSGELTENNVTTYFLDGIKAVRKCATDYDDGTANACYNSDAAPALPADVQDPGAGFVLPGGLTVVDFDNVTCTAAEACGDRIVMDWNGKSAPNTLGNDRMILCFSFGVANWDDGGKITPLPPGSLVACEDEDDSETLYNTVMN